MELLAIAFAIGAVSATADVTPVQIPLKEIWALDMPGTRDIRELEPRRDELKNLTKAERIRASLVEHTRWSLNSNFWPPYGSSAGRGFVVVGTGLDAVREAHAILAEEQPRAEFFPTGEELTLIFYSYECGRYIHLDEVAREGNQLKVKYHFDVHRTANMSTHFALVPLGELPVGKFQVTIKRLPDSGVEARSMDPVLVRRTVCASFSFGVTAERD